METNLLHIPKDVLIMMMLDLDLPDVLKMCRSNKRFNEILCQNPLFWRKRLEKEYPKLDISNVKDYKGLYSYLKRKIRKGEKWGDLTPNGLRVRGSGGMAYEILNEDKTEINPGEMEKSGVTFPTYPPEYFSPLGTNIFVLNYKKINEAAESMSYVTGDFGEKYPVNFKFTSAPEHRIKPFLKYLASSYFPHIVRFVRGEILLDFQERNDLI